MLGVLGGMGPLATADFMQKLISVTPSINDQNHIPAVVWSVPQVADRSEFILNGLEDPFPMLLNGVNKLKSVGACVIAIPCNTAHFWADKLADETRIHILHMADAVAIQVKALLPDGGKVGLLATEGTVKARIYQNRINQESWQILVPNKNDQAELMQGIRSVKSGDIKTAKSIFIKQINTLKQAGADVIILGCTELPTVVEKDSLLIDSNEALALRCVSWYRANFGAI